MEEKIRQQHPGMLMDAVYGLTMVATLLNIDPIPSSAIPYVFIPSYISLLWSYRQSRKYGFGAQGLPLLEQIGLKVPVIVQKIVFYPALLLWFILPFYLGSITASAMAPDGEPAHWPAWAKLVSAVFFLGLAVYTWVCMASEREKDAKLPPPRLRIHQQIVLPLSAAMLGESSAEMAQLLHSRWNDTTAEILIACTVFIPLRVVLMRTTGVNLVTLVSFTLALVASLWSLLAH